MRTLADIKRRMVPGARLEVIAHTRPQLVGTTRTITKAGSAHYQFTTGGQASQTNWPPAASVTILDDDTFRMAVVHSTGKVSGTVTLRFLP